MAVCHDRDFSSYGRLENFSIVHDQTGRRALPYGGRGELREDGSANYGFNALKGKPEEAALINEVRERSISETRWLQSTTKTRLSSARAAVLMLSLNAKYSF